MPKAAESTTAGRPFAPNSIIWEKKGPLPVWAWALILLGLLLAVASWRRNRAKADATASATAYTDELPGDQSAPPIFIVPQAATPAVTVNTPVTVPITNTVPTSPPGAGRDTPPGVPGPLPSTTPKPSSPGKWVEVLHRYTSRNPPWDSTVSGIANHYGVKDWRTVWNHPMNADLRKRRKDPKYIQLHDKIFVPGAK